MLLLLHDWESKLMLILGLIKLSSLHSLDTIAVVVINAP